MESKAGFVSWLTWIRSEKDPAERKLKLTTELNNGRLAMIAMTAMLIQNGLTGVKLGSRCRKGYHQLVCCEKGRFVVGYRDKTGPILSSLAGQSPVESWS